MILFKSNRVTELLDDSSPFDALYGLANSVGSVRLSSRIQPKTHPLAAPTPAHNRTL